MRVNNYKENQKVGRNIRRPLLVVSLIYWCVLIIGPHQNSSIGNDVLLIGCLFFIGALLISFYLLLFTTRFTTIIYPDDRIEIRFWPFFKETIQISAIVEVDIMEYRFSGFGVRYDLLNNTTYYKATGNTYLHLTLSNNKKILIGTNKERELRQFLKKIKTAPSRAIIKSLQTESNKISVNYNK